MANKTPTESGTHPYKSGLHPRKNNRNFAADKRKTMVKRLLFVLTLIAATAATTSPVKKHADGSVTIDTSTLKTVEGYMGPTPLVIHVDAQGLVSRIEALPNEETPAYWRLAMEGLSKAWNGVPADEAVKLEVDAVSGATFSSDAIISNVRAGITCYLESKKR